NSDPNTSAYAIYVLGGWHGIGGTSAAAPLWAAMTALVNQQRASAGKSSFGFSNPALYEFGTSTSAALIFNDITTGNNGVSGHYSAGVGYDNATGFGSFKGSTMIDSASQTQQATVVSTLNPIAFPNPWDGRRETRRQVTISGLTDGATVKIFTLSGFWVKT